VGAVDEAEIAESFRFLREDRGEACDQQQGYRDQGQKLAVAGLHRRVWFWRFWLPWPPAPAPPRFGFACPAWPPAPGRFGFSCAAWPPAPLPVSSGRGGISAGWPAKMSAISELASSCERMLCSFTVSW